MGIASIRWVSQSVTTYVPCGSVQQLCTQFHRPLSNSLHYAAQSISFSPALIHAYSLFPLTGVPTQIQGHVATDTDHTPLLALLLGATQQLFLFRMAGPTPPTLTHSAAPTTASHRTPGCSSGATSQAMTHAMTHMPAEIGLSATLEQVVGVAAVSSLRACSWDGSHRRQQLLLLLLKSDGLIVLHHGGYSNSNLSTDTNVKPECLLARTFAEKSLQ